MRELLAQAPIKFPWAANTARFTHAHVRTNKRVHLPDITLGFSLGEVVMELTVTGRQVEVTAPMREYVKSKLERLSRHFDHVMDVHVILGVEKLKQTAEGTLNLSGKTLHAEANGQDAYAAVDALVDKLDAQIKKHKERLTDHHRGEHLSTPGA